MIGFEGQLLDGVPSGLMTSDYVNMLNTFWDRPTCSGELGCLR